MLDEVRRTSLDTPLTCLLMNSLDLKSRHLSKERSRPWCVNDPYFLDSFTKVRLGHHTEPRAARRPKP